MVMGERYRARSRRSSATQRALSALRLRPVAAVDSIPRSAPRRNYGVLLMLTTIRSQDQGRSSAPGPVESSDWSGRNVGEREGRQLLIAILMVNCILCQQCIRGLS